MTKDVKTIIIVVSFAVVFLLVDIYFVSNNYGFLYHQSNIAADSVNYFREKCASDGGKYVTGWIGGYPSNFCIPN